MPDDWNDAWAALASGPEPGPPPPPGPTDAEFDAMYSAWCAERGDEDEE